MTLRRIFLAASVVLFLALAGSGTVYVSHFYGDWRDGCLFAANTSGKCAPNAPPDPAWDPAQ